jgi:predicted DNA-binding transcriptional regulator AlpA
MIPTGFVAKVQIAARAGISEETLDAWVRAGRFPPASHRAGRRLLWTTPAVDQWFAERGGAAVEARALPRTAE